ncbi:MAG: molybdopterin-dependent oxidoreductase [Deltaproteobacteria bacterium]|nr:molybdopterin-dependent oxidoreductase [Deltaproteobacteria bacterium]
MSETHPSICRFCPAHCGVLVTVEDGAVTKVTGDPDNPLYLGYSCPKGRALPEQHANPLRLLHSQKRGEDGAHRAIASDRAMDEVAAALSDIIERHGPRSVALYVGTNSLPYAPAPGLANAWLRAVGSPMFFTSNTIDQPGKQIAAALHGAWQAGEQDFRTADTWLLVGLNPVISKSAGVPNQNPAQRLKDAVGRGMKLIVVDPRRSETSKRAHIHLQPRPGEDPTLLAGLLHVIIAEELYDHDFTDVNVEGFAELSEAVRPFTPEYVARRADVPREQLVEAARVFGKAARGGCSLGTGPNFAPHGNLSEYLSLCLNSICGRWSRAGDPVLRANVMLPPFTAKAQPHAPYRAWGKGEKLRVRGLTDTAAGLPTAALADEILLPGEGQVKALLCLGGNPMMAWPDQRKAFAALQELELLVSIDIEMSATAQLAHYVIAPKLTLETPGMTLPAEMLKYFGHSIGHSKPYAQYADKAVDPPAGSDLVEEWEFFYGLSQRMELTPQLVGFYGWGRHIESPPRLIPLDMENKPSSEDLHAALCEGSRIPLDEVKQHPHGHIFEEVAPRVEPRDPDCEVRFAAGHPDMLRELDEVHREDYASAWGDARRPFRLIPRRHNDFLNSSGRSIAKLSAKRPHNPAFLHPDDLNELGLESGDAVRIHSAHDSIPALVESDATLRRGLVSMTHAFGGLPTEEDEARFREIGSNTGRLVSSEAEYDSITGIPRMGAIPVALERLREGEGEGEGEGDGG